MRDKTSSNRSSTSVLRKRFIFIIWLLPFGFALFSSTSAYSKSLPVCSVSPWVQANVKFRSAPRWRGGDVAYSVDLRDGRVLWLFGDSFIANRTGASRHDATFIRNSVAIQSNHNILKSKLTFYWKIRNGEPVSFFPGFGNDWLWPTDGVLLHRKLLIFATIVHPDKRRESLGFENSAHTVFEVMNPSDPPSRWIMKRLPMPANPWHIILGASMILTHDYLYVFGAQEPGHSIFLARWPIKTAEQGLMMKPEWWGGISRGWISNKEADISQPMPVIQHGSMEFSISQYGHSNKYLEVQNAEFGNPDIGILWAIDLTGPWSKLDLIYHPPPSRSYETIHLRCKGAPGIEFGKRYNHHLRHE